MVIAAYRTQKVSHGKDGILRKDYRPLNKATSGRRIVIIILKESLHAFGK